MSIPTALEKLFGTWSGKNSLWFTPDDPARVSDTTAAVASAVEGKFVTLNYTWVFEGQPQAGLILLGYEQAENAVSGVWVDSFHMDHKMMTCQGNVNSDGIISINGAYSVPDAPDWGWQIDVVVQSETSFKLVMYNITPEGQAFLAVEADYARTP